VRRITWLPASLEVEEQAAAREAGGEHVVAVVVLADPDLEVVERLRSSREAREILR
jgi:hypothetical protein